MTPVRFTGTGNILYQHVSVPVGAIDRQLALPPDTAYEDEGGYRFFYSQGKVVCIVPLVELPKEHVCLNP